MKRTLSSLRKRFLSQTTTTNGGINGFEILIIIRKNQNSETGKLTIHAMYLVYDNPRHETTKDQDNEAS